MAEMTSVSSVSLAGPKSDGCRHVRTNDLATNMLVCPSLNLVGILSFNTMKYSDLIEKFRNLSKELQGHGASSEEAHALAACLAVKSIATPLHGSEENELYRRIKGEGEPYAYFYGSIIIERISVESNPSVGLRIVIRIPVGHRPVKVELKKYQAVRFLSLLKLKFMNFEKDARQGFLYSELEKSDVDIITNHKLSINYESIPSGRELYRAIGDSFQDKIGQNQILERLNPEENQARVRIGYSPSRVIFQSEKLFDSFEILTDNAFSKFSDLYDIRLPFKARSPHQA